jgi:hypothetical protein
MSELHWLWRLTYPECHHPLGHQPYLFEHDGAVWSAATNGRVAVFLSGRAGDLEQAPPDLAAILLRNFEPTGTRTGFYLDELKAFLGHAVWSVKCDLCDGRNGECPECEGTGRRAALARPGWLCGVPMDRNLLAMALESLTAGVIWIYTRNSSDPFIVVAEGWRVAQAPLLLGPSGDGYTQDWENAPRLG